MARKFNLHTQICFVCSGFFGSLGGLLLRKACSLEVILKVMFLGDQQLAKRQSGGWLRHFFSEEAWPSASFEEKRKQL